MPARNRGFTLIELMVASAIAAVMFAAAVAVVVAGVQSKRLGERKIEVQMSTSVAATQIQADLMNAGYRFAAPAFGFRHYNNVTGAVQLSNPLGGGPISTTGNCGAATGRLVAGTDVIEMAEGAAGSPISSGGSTSRDGVSTAVASGSQYQVFMSGMAPFATGAPTGQIVLFADAVGLACMGRVTSTGNVLPNAPATVLVEMLNRDYQVNATHSSDYNGANACPAGNMTAFRLGRRVRYFVCQQNTPNTRPALYRQVSGSDGVMGIPELIQEGIEDLQVSPRQLNRPGPGVHSGASCVVAPGNQNYCYCNDAATNSCDGVDNTTFLQARSYPSLVRGARVSVTAVSTRRASDSPTPELGRGALFDHAAGTPDGLARATQTFSLGFNNFTMVTP